MAAKRTVEYYRLWDDQTWDTDCIEIEPNENLDRAVEIAAEGIVWKSDIPWRVGFYAECEEEGAEEGD